MKYMHRMMLTVCSVLLLVVPAFVQAAQTVRVGYEQNPPMASTADNGKAQGIMIDIVGEVARREGWSIQYAPCVWNKCLENLENAEIDLLVSIAHTPEKAQKYSYNLHTVISNWGLLYSRLGQKIESYADLNGKRITVVKNDVYCNTFIKMLRQFSMSCDLVYVDSFRDIDNQGFWQAYPPCARLGLSFVERANPEHFQHDLAFGWGFYGHRTKTCIVVPFPMKSLISLGVVSIKVLRPTLWLPPTWMASFRRSALLMTGFWRCMAQSSGCSAAVPAVMPSGPTMNRSPLTQ